MSNGLGLDPCGSNGLVKNNAFQIQYHDNVKQIPSTEIFRAEVLEVDINPKFPENFGRIKFRRDDHVGENEEVLSWAIPLNPYLRLYPVVGEIVSINSFNGKYFYNGTINIFNSLNNNVNEGLTDDNTIFRSQQSNNYSERVNYNLPPKRSNSSGDSGKRSFQNSFRDNNSVVSHLPIQEGDIIFQGRFGQSIRFGNNPETNSPNIKICSKELEQTIFSIEEEDLNNHSCIFITSDEILDFNQIGPSISQENSPPSELNGNQIGIFSDRLVFGSKVNETLIYSNKTISLSSEDNFSVDTNNQVIMKSVQETKLQALKVMIGSLDADEPLVLGNKWKEIMLELINYLMSHTHSTGTGPSGPPINMPDFQNVYNSINDDTQLSDDNFTTKVNG